MFMKIFVMCLKFRQTAWVFVPGSYRYLSHFPAPSLNTELCVCGDGSCSVGLSIAPSFYSLRDALIAEMNIFTFW